LLELVIGEPRRTSSEFVLPRSNEEETIAVDERGRLQLADAANRVFGDEAGITLMELLPPVGWADVATKQDLVHLETVMNARFDAVDRTFESIDRRFDNVEVRLDRLESTVDDMAHELRTLTWKLVTVVIAVVGTVAAAVRL
jgi:hypothetical protein